MSKMQGFFEGDVDTPISMVNLLKFKKHAEYEDGRNTQLSGRGICNICRGNKSTSQSWCEINFFGHSFKTDR